MGGAGSARQQRCMVKLWQHMPGEQVGFGGVRVAGQDESVHAEVA